MPLRERQKLDDEKDIRLRAEVLQKITLTENPNVDIEEYLNVNRTNIRRIIDTRDNQSYSLLHHAVRKNLAVGVKLLIKELGADVNIMADDDVTPLHLAVKHETDYSINFEIHNWVDQSPEVMEDEVTIATNAYIDKVEKEIINILIDNGAQINAKDRAGWTPLHHAVNFCNFIGVKTLVERGADLKIADINGMTPILLAAKRGFHTILELMTKDEFDADQVSADGCNLLHFACQQRTNIIFHSIRKAIVYHSGTETYYRLLDQNNYMNETPVHWVAKYSGLSLLELCAKPGTSYTLINEKKETLLHMAAQFGKLVMLSTLLTWGIDVEAVDINGQTALTHAAKRNHNIVVRSLALANANLNTIDVNYRTPLMHAAMLGYDDICQTLIESGASFEIKDLDLKTCFHLAVEGGKFECVKTLIDGYIKRGETDKNLINVADAQGDTPMHAAVMKGNIEMLVVLRGGGGSLTDINDRQMTLLQYAVGYGHYDICVYIASEDETCVHRPNEDGNLPIHEAARKGQYKILSYLIKNYGNVSARNYYGYTPLHFAVANNHITCTKILLRIKKVDINEGDKDLMTPIFMACLQGHSDMVNLLLMNKADPNILVRAEHQLHPSWNALDAAVHAKNMACVKIILDSEQWKSTMKNQTVYENNTHDTPLRRMIRDLPEAAEYICQRMAECNHLPEQHEDYQVKFTFEYLEDDDKRMKEAKKAIAEEIENESKNSTDAYDSKFFNWIRKYYEQRKREARIPKPIHPIALMLRYERLDLLKCELIQSLLAYKWTWLAIPYTINVIIYLLFVAFFTSFMLQTKAPYYFTNETYPTIRSACENLEMKQLKAYEPYISVPKYGVLLLALINLGKELGQFARSRLAYISLDNILELTIYIAAVSISVDTGPCMTTTGLRENWQWQLGSVGILSAWINLLLFIQKVLAIGTYVGMFLKILRSLVKLFLVFAPFILAFALNFYLILGNQIGFNNMPDSITKTFAMLSGEVNLADTLFSRYAPDSGPEQAVPYAFITYVLYVMFIALMVITLANLITGVAVGDVDAIQSEVDNERLKTKIQTFFDAQSIFEALRFSLNIDPEYTVLINSTTKLRDNFFLYFFPSQTTTEDDETILSNESLQLTDSKATRTENLQRIEDNVESTRQFIDRRFDEINIKKKRHTEEDIQAIE